MKFQRIIANGKFIPEIDGLRFIAILSVVLFHLNIFLIEKDVHSYESNYDFSVFNALLARGNYGVTLFFVISGFILGRPFADKHINHMPCVSLPSYFMRRITRLEPPYIIVMTVMLFATVYGAKTLTLHQGIASYLASITYTHNFLYGREVLPLLNGVAWSLEIEVQFYIFAPLLGLVFRLRNPILRRLAVILGCLFFLLLEHFVAMPFRSLLNYCEFFLLGYLLADLYVCRTLALNTFKFASFFAFVIFAFLWLMRSNQADNASQKIFLEIGELTSIFGLYYLILFQKAFGFLTYSWVTNIGGMCYSIYLLHVPVIASFGNQFIKRKYANDGLVNTFIYSLVLLTVIYLVSAVYFLLVERPCMDKNWPKNFIRLFRSLLAHNFLSRKNR
ncbi:MAG: acyltransferase [Pirellulaceae bacterium]|nr:acyltransferase [Pirellulaceae bacterium]